MSARALKKLRERELAAKAAAEPQLVEEEEEDESEGEAAPAPKVNLFALLGGEDDDNDDDGEPKREESEVEDEEPVAKKEAASSSKKKSKKKKKKKKAATPAVETPPVVENESEDEIDRALKELKLKQKARDGEVDVDEKPAPVRPRYQLLEVDTRNLDVSIELKRLFGRAATIDDAGEGPAAGGLGNMRQGGQARGGRRGIVATSRRNLFVQPKTNWPNVGTGGLGMEIVERKDSGEVLFTYVHSAGYKELEMGFFECIFAMDHMRLGTVLQQNPYHVSTNLQLGEIALTERDNSSSGEFIERALFNLGRSAHSQFSKLLAEGKARLDFSRFESRELWLAVWKYIQNLGVRGTWKTAEEYGRLLFSLDPEKDPYQMCLMLDYLALRASQPERLLSLIEDPAFSDRFSHLPNLAYSIPLAYLQLEKIALAQEYLAKAITRFPWIVSRLYGVLGIDDPLPPALWGNLPPEDRPLQKVLCELYAERASVIWNTPEAIELLKGTAKNIFNVPKPKSVEPLLAGEERVYSGVPLSVARHVILSGFNSVVHALPRQFTQMNIVSYDPFTPSNEKSTYRSILLQEGTGEETAAAPGEQPSLLAALPAFFRSLIPSEPLPEQAGGPQPAGQQPQRPVAVPDRVITQEELMEAIRQTDARILAEARRHAFVEDAEDGAEDVSEEEEEIFDMETTMVHEYQFRASESYFHDEERNVEVICFLLLPWLWVHKPEVKELDAVKYKFLEGRDYARAALHLLSLSDEKLTSIFNDIRATSLLPDLPSPTNPPIPTVRNISDNDTPILSLQHVTRLLHSTKLADFPSGNNQKFREAEEIMRGILSLAPDINEGGTGAFVKRYLAEMVGVADEGREETKRRVWRIANSLGD